jgi:hypothetical protein
MTEKKTYGVGIEDTALAFSTEGVTPSNWIQDTAGAAWDAVKRGVKSVLDFASNILEGGKEMLAAISRGDWKLFGQWFRDDPGSAIAGAGAVAIVGWLGASATGLTSIVAGGISSLWATLGAVRLGGVTLGLMLPTLQQAILGVGGVIVNTDWTRSDSSILTELTSTYNAFLNTLGESTGRLLANLALGGGKNKPRMEINVTAAASLSIIAAQNGSDIEEELAQELSQLANSFIRYATNLAGKLGYLQVRKWARENLRTGIPAIDNQIKTWGLIEGQSFSINAKIDEKIDEITDNNAPLGNFLEGLKEGFSDGFTDFILLT